jgi:uncharacterized iron-regulated protein
MEISAMRVKTVVIIAFSLVGLSCHQQKTNLNHRFFDLTHEKDAGVEQVLPELKQSRLILVGEQHDNERHHQAQLAVVRMLHESGVDVAIGMEMFRKNTQPALDQWVAGEMDEKTFQAIYYDNWNFDWRLYRPILEYARQNRIPVIGLNVPKEITRQVARQGYQSLDEEQRHALGDVACRVDKEYMEFIRRSYGAHAHGNMQFLYFCEAQMVWDAAMAVNALDFLEAHPNRAMVLMAGTGHVRKQAIPAQVRQRVELPITVILPEVPGVIESGMVDRRDADFIYIHR